MKAWLFVVACVGPVLASAQPYPDTFGEVPPGVVGLPGCAADLTTCKGMSYFPVSHCEEWAYCNDNIAKYGFDQWRQNINHTCVCEEGYRGTDCGIVEPPSKNPVTGEEHSYCPPGQYWDSVPLPIPGANKHVECFIDTELSLLSLRLHRVNMTLLPAENLTQPVSMHWELKSRHRNYTFPKGTPEHHMCQNMTTDIRCLLTQCTLEADASCDTIVYECYHADCSSDSGSMEIFVKKLNSPDNWPLKLEFGDVDPAEGNSTQTLYTGLLNFLQHCTTGMCVDEEPTCSAASIANPKDSMASYIVLGGFGCVVCGLAVVSVCLTHLARRPRKRQYSSAGSKSKSYSNLDVEIQPVVDPLHAERPDQTLLSSPVMSAPSMGVIFQDVTYDVPVPATSSWWRSCCASRSGSTKRVLHGLTGCIRPSELVALMGPSGAGKSSLMDILASHEKSGAVSGNVEYHWSTHRVNARDVDSGSTAHTGIAGVGYVYQDDRLLPTETVRETLLFSARMRLPRHLSESTVEARVQSTLNALELDHIADSRVGSPDAGGGISGGERKRVAIGVELLANPRLLLLDEPTTGLDSHSVDVVMRVLRQTAAGGCACVVSIHQPTSATFRSFDKLVLLTSGGRLAFCGPPMAAVSHFAEELQLDVPRIRSSTAGSAMSRLFPDITAPAAAVDARPAPSAYGSADSTSRVETKALPGEVRPPSPAPPSAGSAAALSIQVPKSPSASPKPADGTDSDSEDESLMVNPAEMLLESATTELGSDADQLASSFRSSTHGEAVSAQISAVLSSCTVLADGMLPQQGKVTWLTPVATFGLLCGRGFRQMVRNPALLLTQSMMTLLVGVCIGVLFWDLPYDLNGVHNRTGVLFFNIVYFSLGSMSSLGVLILEKNTFFRERARGFYTTAPYFLSKVVVDLLPLRVVPPLVYGGMTYYMMNLNSDPTRFATFLIGMCLINTTAAVACYVISAFSSSISKANLVASLFFVFNVLFGGLLLTDRSKVVAAVMYLSVFNYGFQLLMMNEFFRMKEVINFNPPGSGALPITGEEWIYEIGINGLAHPNLAQENMGILLGLILAGLLAAYLGLAYHQRYVK